MRRTASILFVLTVAALGMATYPAWWAQRAVIDPHRVPSDFHAVNQGQVKWIATQAYEELREKLPGPGLTAIRAILDAFPEGHDYRPANLGMLKHVAQPFYDHLIAEGFASAYPWEGGTPADYAIANQGQLKNLFSFDLDAIDSNGDGIPDWFARLYGERHELAAQPGPEGVRVSGNWLGETDILHALSLQGELRYRLELPSAGVYAVEVEGRNSLSGERRFEIELLAEGLSCGRAAFTADSARTGKALFFLPALPAGPVDVVVRWHNLDLNARLAIVAVRLVDFSGEHWRAHRAALAADLADTPESSLISPVCLEGQARWIERLTILAGPESATSEDDLALDARRGVGLGWYANVPLAEEGATRLRVTDAESGMDWERRIEWAALNLLDAPSPVMTIRVGDALRFSAYPPEMPDGQSVIRIGPLQETIEAPEALALVFETPGSYLVEGQWSRDGDAAQDAVLVRVLDAAFHPATALWVGRPRDWLCAALPAEAHIEHDIGLYLREHHPVPPAGRTFALSAAGSGSYVVLARLGAEGPILARTRIEAFDVLASNRTGYRHEGEVLADGTRVIVMPVSAADLPEGASLRLQIIISGVTFEDGSRVKWIHREDLDADGLYHVRFLVSPDHDGTPCHRFEVWQDGVRIGRR